MVCAAGTEPALAMVRVEEKARGEMPIPAMGALVRAGRAEVRAARATWKRTRGCPTARRGA